MREDEGEWGGWEGGREGNEILYDTSSTSEWNRDGLNCAVVVFTVLCVVAVLYGILEWWCIERVCPLALRAV